MKKETSSFRRFAFITLLVLIAILVALLLWQGQLPIGNNQPQASVTTPAGASPNPPGPTEANTTPTNLNNNPNSSPVANANPTAVANPNPTLIIVTAPTPTPKPALKLETVVVTGPTKKPVTDAILKKPDGTEVAKTDSTGKLAANNLDEGSYTVSAPGYNSFSLTLAAGQTLSNIELKPYIFQGSVVDATNKQPLAGKLVYGGDTTTVTDSNGSFSFTALPPGTKVRVALIGYTSVEQTVEDKDQLVTFDLKSTQFDGSLTDSASNKPIPNALIKIDDNTTALTGQDGKFHFSDGPHTDDTVITVRAPGYKIQTFKASELEKGAKMAPFHFRGVYVPGAFAINANYDEEFTPYLKMADEGQINAVVIGVKDDDTGLLWYNSQVPLAKQLGLVYNLNGVQPDELMDPKKLIADAHKHGLYVVARYVVFRDPSIAAKKPEWAIKSIKTGKPWVDDNGLTWPNQFQPEVSDYNADLAKELAGLGFDEVNYDYIRFPTDGALKDIQYKPDLDWTQLSQDEKLRTDTIESAVLKAYDNLRTTNTFFSLDVFGYSLWRVNDADGIGQQYNDLVFMSDYICPMVYASLFSPGEMGFDDPGAHPKEIIEESGRIASKLEEQLKPVAKYRPWLEDYDKLYGPPETQFKSTAERVEVQINAADTGGASGWTLWNANGDYITQALSDTAPPKR
ncbi:MAG: carboxypeptidase regulatory-like domain-containing protein [Chloroflexi bacterium]|nr:carboxypeptidase regulatory-like domain-containing protein [Chloroflexota bacterium]OJV93262.1 MAG: hypothetical protein BGO39_14975 [Chloroflexi bacterium 54-19]